MGSFRTTIVRHVQTIGVTVRPYSEEIQRDTATTLATHNVSTHNIYKRINEYMKYSFMTDSCHQIAQYSGVCRLLLQSSAEGCLRCKIRLQIDAVCRCMQNRSQPVHASKHLRGASYPRAVRCLERKLTGRPVGRSRRFLSAINFMLELFCPCERKVDTLRIFIICMRTFWFGFLSRTYHEYRQNALLSSLQRQSRWFRQLL